YSRSSIALAMGSGKELTYYLILNNISNNIKQCELLCVHGIVNIIKRKSIRMLLGNYINILE
ncbi:hypothetical protein, partial [Morganella morganii]|uniref:hypothetical protein n=1 Tax=Morganella morganii TaxID=582 RepID=UPI0013D4FA53